jgi:outer membrane protein TolC
MHAANAQIGVAEAAFFPTITLTARGGTASSTIENLARASDPFWSLGLALAQPLFDAGLRSAQVEQSRAAYDRTVADYRQVVLTSFQQVEDQIAALRVLAEQAQVLDAALQAAREAERLALNQYQAGTTAYTTVVTAQVARLNNEQAALDVLSRRLIATAALIGALGGSWDPGDLPAADRLYEVAPLDPGAPQPQGPPGFFDGFGTAVRNLFK